VHDQSELSLRPARGVGELLLELSFVVVFGLVQALSWARLTQSSASWGAILPGLVAGWLGADLLSGLIHFAADNHGSTSTPLLGKMVISTFREHHHEPQKMLAHGLLERNGWNCACAAVLTCPVLWCDAVAQNPFVASCLVSGGFFAGATNQIHAWAHNPQRPGWVTHLQQSGFILAARSHRKHHHLVESTMTASWLMPSSAPTTSGSKESFFRGHYCITSGVWDRIFRWWRHRGFDR
jgi:hypothetical protein